jgi:hypothetical protein
VVVSSASSTKESAGECMKFATNACMLEWKRLKSLSLLSLLVLSVNRRRFDSSLERDELIMTSLELGVKGEVMSGG